MDFQFFRHGKITGFHCPQHLHNRGKETGIIPDSHKRNQDRPHGQNDQDKTYPNQRRKVQLPEHTAVYHTNIGKIILAGREYRIKYPIIAGPVKSPLAFLQFFCGTDPVPFLLCGIIHMQRLSLLHNRPCSGNVQSAEQILPIHPEGKAPQLPADGIRIADLIGGQHQIPEARNIQSILFPIQSECHVHVPR